MDINDLSIEQPTITLYQNSHKKDRNNDLSHADMTSVVNQITKDLAQSTDHKSAIEIDNRALDQEQTEKQPNFSHHSVSKALVIDHLNIHNGSLVYKDLDQKIIYTIKGISINNNDLSVSQNTLHAPFSDADWMFNSSSHGTLAIHQLKWGPWQLSDISMFYNIHHGKITLSPIVYTF